jgi:predicted phosphodiesterase
MEAYQHSIHSILARYAKMPPHIRIFALGDLIEGSTIFHGQQRAIDMTTVQQIFAIIDYLAQLLNDLSKVAPITLYGVVGNHGRIGRKGENDPMDNLDYLAYKWLEERLAPNKRITVHISESWFQLVEVRNHRFLLVHGDGIYGSYLGIPMYGSLKHEGNWQKLLKDFGGFDYLVVGHHHTPAHLQNIIMNGAWPGGSEFSLRQMTRGGRPSQKTFNVHPRIGITDMRDILLDVEETTEVKVYK